MDRCRYCNSNALYTRPQPPHLGLYCGDCGRFQKWVKQEQNIETGEPASDKQHSYALKLMTDWISKDVKLTQRQARAIIQAFKE